MWRSAGPITFVSILTAVACGSTDAGNGDGAGPSVGTDGGSAATPDGGVTSTDGGTATTPHDDCPVDEKTCSGALVAHVCESTPEGTRWKDEPCASGQGCVQGACAPAACSDECAVGDVQGGKTCALYDVTNGTWGDLDAATKLSDRARAYAAYLRKNEMAFGGVASMHYTDATLATPDAAHGIGDSSIWTGTYLASEALRAMATGSKDAHDEIVRVVKTLDLFFHVSGEPATLSRFVRETGANPGYSLPDLDCANTTEMHCNVTYMGKQYDALGHISRDQYQGFMLGMTLAYEALGSEDEDTRAVI
ncbi:MAG TPA: hypothetical protein VF407_10780, partial [Polyangiaceae bacterium]